MHIILGILGVVVTILVLLNRLQEGGIDIGWLNPFSWNRRRKFRQQYELPSYYSLDSPMDVAALFMLSIAKADGDITKEQKNELLELFQTEFKLSFEESKSLLASSSHILGNGAEVKSNPKSVIAKSFESFTPEQSESTKQLLTHVANIEGQPSSEQQKLLKSIISVLPSSNEAKW
ncbi:TerB family tellurite resistance protein [Vibrio sp. SS-MA-C1-2]|uniref:tellurite resistance TerB family protein n=1 Tax=Vibrio sp. SS-MA-C1-2 TaxID=2908646 RepID=UPI001F31107D|nr:TerB family tellurite resistance protein [Vibrio sp. SS-MA-C1-2]UJF17264.1 TerB family tellurite resistance protein [Vibrio sp. SS-MA-C1-2]